MSGSTIIGNGTIQSQTIGQGATLAAGLIEIGANAGGSGTLSILSGGTVDSGGSLAVGAGALDAALIIGYAAGTGSLTVTDPGSTYDAQGQADIGTTGAGSLLVENGGSFLAGGSATASDAGFFVGWGAASNGAVSVTGAGSEIVNVGHFVIGGSGTGTHEANESLATGGPASLLIEAGGLVSTGRPGTVSLSAPGADIAATPGTGGSAVSVTGANSTWRIGGPLLVGDDAAGSLTVSAGGTVSASEIVAGVAPAGGGVISLSGTGSTIDVSGLVMIGDAGSGALSIGSGATLTAGTLVVGLADSVTLLGGWLDVPGGITNSGTISNIGSAAELSGAIGGSGAMSIGAGADLQLDNAVGSGQTLFFGGAGGTLAIGQPAGFSGTIDGFTRGDFIDAVGATSGTVSGNVVTLFSGGFPIGTLTLGNAVADVTVVGGSSEAVVAVGTGSATTTSADVSVSTLTGGFRYVSTTQNDVISTPAGDQNQVSLGSGADTVYSAGADTITGGGGSATINASGKAVVFTSDTLDFVNGAGTSVLVLSGAASVSGGSGAVHVFGGSSTLVAAGGTAGGNALVAGSGNATLNGGGSGDIIVGGAAGSSDVVSTTGSISAIFAGAASMTASDGSALQYFIGGAGADTITQSTGSERIILGSGNIVLNEAAGSGTDIIALFSGVAGGAVTVNGFGVHKDILYVGGYGSNAIANAVSAASVTSAGTSFTFADGSKITLSGISDPGSVLFYPTGS